MSERIIPRSPQPVGGPTVEPRPAWFIDMHGYMFILCACGELVLRLAPKISPLGKMEETFKHDVVWCGFEADLILADYRPEDIL